MAVKLVSPKSRQSPSPFFSRTYGGFTPTQKQFVSLLVDSPQGKIIFDPMAGQGDFLAQFSWKGGRVRLGDLNPAVLCLARLREPALLMQADELKNRIGYIIERLRPSRSLGEPLSFSSSWLSQPLRDQLHAYGKSFNLDRLGNPFSQDSRVWRLDAEGSLAIGLPLLASRELVAHRSSDNVTWIKQGGLQRVSHVFEPLSTALDNWYVYAKKVSSLVSLGGELCVEWLDLTRSVSTESNLADVIVTSPPYANRLDYSRLWAPEIEVLCALLGIDSPNLTAQQVGSTVIKGVSEFAEEEVLLPEPVRIVLDTIRQDKISKASDSYYYPFFRNYAVSLRRAVKNIVNALKPGGQLTMFVRDTARKDIVFPTAGLIEATLQECEGMERLLPTEAHVVRKHIGLRRRREGTGLRGLAQQEWWLVYKKRE